MSTNEGIKTAETSRQVFLQGGSTKGKEVGSMKEKLINPDNT